MFTYLLLIWACTSRGHQV